VGGLLYLVYQLISDRKVFNEIIVLPLKMLLCGVTNWQNASDHQMGITEPTTSPYFNLNDKNAEKRLVVDLRAVNPLTVTGGRNYPQTSFFACCSANSWNLKKMLW